MADDTISLDELRTARKALAKGKATGLDGLSGDLLKQEEPWQCVEGKVLA